ncbi:hypothetical protein HPP92_012051 [Vanilla planifolia]|uniref:Uncharacterized protein n=1 Tax=Vanilla planifolia TaxID=51239 RepID=A0A835V3E1_VANPL|nr:hypothetical protein HPP92_012051 [Vanilla planifolia]
MPGVAGNLRHGRGGGAGIRCCRKGVQGSKAKTNFPLSDASPSPSPIVIATVNGSSARTTSSQNSTLDSSSREAASLPPLATPLRPLDLDFLSPSAPRFPFHHFPPVSPKCRGNPRGSHLSSSNIS